MFWSKKVEKKFSKKSYRMEVQDITNNNKVVYTCHGDFCDSSEAWDDIKSRFLQYYKSARTQGKKVGFYLYRNNVMDGFKIITV